MYKYHAAAKGTKPQAGGYALCGANGTMDRYHVVTVSAARWNETAAEHRCARCVDAIRRAKVAKAAKVAARGHQAE